MRYSRSEGNIPHLSTRKRSLYLVSAEVADAVGVPMQTLSRWIKTKQVIPPEQNPANQYRSWLPEHITELKHRIRVGELQVKPDYRNQARRCREAT